MNIVITGASGLLGTELIYQLQHTTHNIFALTSNKEALLSKWTADNVHIHSVEEWESRAFSLEGKDVIIHSGFARAHKGGEEIAKAMIFTKRLFDEIRDKKVKGLINISTQEVYGKKNAPWREEDQVEPNTIYGTAKYFTELLAHELANKHGINSTNIRLAGLLSTATESRMVNKFVHQAIKGEPIKILDSKLLFSQVSVRDAAAGIIALLNIPHNEWENIYNLGYIKSYSIQEIASIIQNVGNKHGKEVIIVKEESNSIIHAELDSTKLYKQTNWLPKKDMKNIIKEVFEHRLNIQS